jgi:hypothetical protein
MDHEQIADAASVLDPEGVGIYQLVTDIAGGDTGQIPEALETVAELREKLDRIEAWLREVGS